VLGTTLLLISGAVVVGSALLGGETHTLHGNFDAAVQVASGQEVRVAGRKVGEVGSIEVVDGRAVVELKIQEDEVWPLPRGTTAGMRWGSTTSLAYRYIELHPGPRSAPDLPEDGVLKLADTETPFELDQSFRIFRGRTKGDLRALVGQVGDTVDGRGKAIEEGLREAPGGLDEAAGFLGELSADQEALRTLVVSGDRATSALADRERELGELVGHAASTFDEFATHSADQQKALDRAPAALAESTTTLARLDRSLVGLQALTNDLGPGARELRTLAPPARRAFAELNSVAPVASAALASGRRAAPPLRRLFTTGKGFLPRLGTALGQLDPVFGCLRPYGPELAGNLSTWSGYNKNFDNGGHYARTFPLQVNPALPTGTPMNSAQIVALLGGSLKYAMPRPPGLNAGDPWFQPECGAGPDSVDVSKDPEGAGK
jgi:phospholipid/cholesterol/gamma-HCH transport system substrate-binding protein